MMSKVTLKIEFDSQEASDHFVGWLDGQGEQDYWMWMEYREQEELGDITAIEFDYNQKLVDGKFVADNTIRTVCSRLDK